MEELNTAEFTEKFCVERFKAGEMAMSVSGVFFKIVDHSENAYNEKYLCGGKWKDHAMSFETARKYQHEWRMRPAKDGGWIKHDGSRICPIPWAKAEEWEQEFNAGNGLTRTLGDIPTIHFWENIKRYRLTDGWIPVIGGKPAFSAGTNEWEYKTVSNDGIKRIATGSTDDYAHEGMFIVNGYNHIVAIRRIDLSTKPQKVDASAERVQENEKSEHGEEVVAQKVSVDENGNVTVRNITRKEFYKPLSQNEMMRIAGRALNGMERQRIEVEHSVVAAIRKDW